MAKLSDQVSEYGDRVKVKILRILCSDCGQALPDEAIERVISEQEVTVDCSACGNPITLSLYDLDRLCDRLVNGSERHN